MTEAWKAWVRSVRGQLSLLAATLAGAVAVSVVIVCLRGVLFEHYVREKYPPAGAWAEEAARDLTVPDAPPTRLTEIRTAAAKMYNLACETKRPAKELEELYGFWIENPHLDPHGSLAVRLTQYVPEWVVARLRRTLAAGSPTQRERALQWLLAIADVNEVAGSVRELATQARHRAATRGEESIRLQAEAVLASGRLAETK